MDTDEFTGNSAIYVIDDCLIVPLCRDLHMGTAMDIQHSVLQNLQNTGLKKVLVDLSSVNVMDRKTFLLISRIADMNRMLGAETVFAGIQPGIASSLVDLDVDCENLQTAISMKEGIESLRRKTG